tara:strand:+ start:1348 stop:2175 length:828 start_codon:yes stop_codon:yes gene_type:complete
MDKIIIHLICPDQKGIIAQITSIILKTNNNILSIEQHVDNEQNKFYIRLLIDLKDSKVEIKDLQNQLENLNKTLDGKIFLYNPNKKNNVAIFGTKESEPIYDLLIKNKSDALNCNFPLILSNHDSLKVISKQFDILYFKTNDENEILDICKKYNIELIVLARYMQIISDKIINNFKNKIINIHHGFLPAFKGANPYKQAFKKGVKIIGATAHYVTKELDEGPIICQDVIHVDHKKSIKDMMKLGRDIEKKVLYNAVKSHLDYKIIIENNKTIIFN